MFTKKIIGDCSKQQADDEGGEELEEWSGGAKKGLRYFVHKCLGLLREKKCNAG